MNIEDQNLLHEAINGNEQAFCALLEEYYTMIYNTAFKWLGNPEDSECVAQETCIKVGGSIRKFRMDSKFSTWLYRIVINTAKDFQYKHRKNINIDEIPETKLTDVDSPEKRAERTQLWKLVCQLPEKQRDAVLLVYAEGLSHREVADIMGCKENTVSWYIHEAKKQLKILITDDGQ